MDIEHEYKCTKCKADTIHVRVYIQMKLYDLCKECHDKQLEYRDYIADRELDIKQGIDYLYMYRDID